MPQPQVAHAEDYDSEESCAKPGTRKDARRRATTSSRPPRSMDRYRSAPPRDGASDSGYSSHTSGPQVNKRTAPAVQAPSRPATAQSSTKSKPILHRSSSQRSSSQRSKDKPSRSSSTSRQTEQCGDRNCQHAACHNIRKLEYQQATSQQYAPQYSPQHATHYAAASQQYQPQTAQYQNQYPQAPQVPPTQNVPVLTAQPRPRPAGTSRPARPASFHAHSSPALYTSSNQGPPPSVSAYQNIQYAAWVQAYQQQQQQLQQQQAYQQRNSYRPPPLQQNIPAYPQQSPVMTSPVSPNFSTAPDYSSGYSARTTNPVYEAAMQRRPITTLHRTYSARPAPSRAPTMPGAFPPDEPISEGSSDSESSASEYSEDEYERDRRSRARDSRLMSSSSDRRPSLKKQHATSPVLPTRSARDVLRRNPKTDTSLDYISSSDNVDSDKTARAVVDRPRHAYTNSSRSSRRPSVSTTASSGRTKATTVSSGSGLANVIVERNGRHVTYLSQRDREALEYARRQMEDRKLQDEVRAYQDSMRGAAPPELTVDNMFEHDRRGSGSHYSGHSRRASRSSSRKPEGTRIETGGTVIHLDAGTTVEMRPGKDGASTIVIGTASGKESSYYSASRVSSNRRDSRNYGGSDGGSKREETIQEDEVDDQSNERLSEGVSSLHI